MNASYVRIFNEVRDLLQSPDAKELRPQERVSIMSMARSALSVPATIWSPEDLLEFIPERVCNPVGVAEDLWENLDMDITEAEWATIEAHVAGSLRELGLNDAS